MVEPVRPGAVDGRRRGLVPPVVVVLARLRSRSAERFPLLLAAPGAVPMGEATPDSVASKNSSSPPLVPTVVLLPLLTALGGYG